MVGSESFILDGSRKYGKRSDFIACVLTLSFEEGRLKTHKRQIRTQGTPPSASRAEQRNDSGKLRRKRFNARIGRSFSVWSVFHAGMPSAASPALTRAFVLQTGTSLFSRPLFPYTETGRRGIIHGSLRCSMPSGSLQPLPRRRSGSPGPSPCPSRS